MAQKKFKYTEPDLLPVMNLFSVLIPFLLSISTFQKLGIVEVTLPERSDMVMNEDPPEPDDQALNLTVAVTNDYLQIVARGGMMPMIFYKEMWTFRCKSDNDTTTIDPKTLGEVKEDGTFTNPAKCKDGKETNKYEIEQVHLWTLLKQTEEDVGVPVTSLYAKDDSAYVDGNNEFITSRNGIQVGSVIQTLQESSARKITAEKLAGMKLAPRSAYDELAKSLIGIHTRFIDAPDADNIIVLADDNAIFDKVISVMDRARDSGFWKISLAKLGG
jgi:biopolymer transport protein ExbD